MNLKRLLIFLPILLLFVITFSSFMPYQGGAPSPYYYTGSPGDAHSCSSCHGGSSTAAGWVTSNIPGSGYVPGTVYQITATNSISGSGRYGFELSPQSPTGTYLGTLAAGTGTKLVGTKWITHSTASTTVSSWTFSWTAPPAGTGDVTFYASFARSTGSSVRLSTLVVTEAASTPAAAGPISGPVTVCANASSNYSVGTIAGATSYVWSVPSGANITAGQGTTNITVQFGSSTGSGVVSVYGSNTNGNGAPSNLSVTVSTVPAPAGAVTGTSSPCESSTEAYSVPNTAGITYTWTFPAGTTILSGQGNSTVSVLIGSTGGSIQVVPSNTCGNGTASSKLITVSPLPAQPGNITGQASACQGSSQVYTVANTAGVTYNWLVPSGSVITAGQGTNSVTVTLGSTSGMINVEPTNLCGTGPAQSISLDIQALPGTASAATGPLQVASNITPTSNYFTTGAANASNYTWELTPAGAGTIAGTGTTGTVTWNSLYTGTAQVRVKGSNNCGEGTWSNQLAVQVINTTSVRALQEIAVSVFPSPNNGEFTIRVNTAENHTTAIILDGTGKQYYKGPVNENGNTKLKLPLAAGIYFLRIEAGNKNSVQSFIVK